MAVDIGNIPDFQKYSGVPEWALPPKTVEGTAPGSVDLSDPKKSANVIWRFMEFEMNAMQTMQDEIFGQVDPSTGQRAGGLMGQLNGQNAQLSEINNFLTQATQAQQADSDDQTINPDLVNYLAQQAGGIDPKTGEPLNPLGLTKDSSGHWENDYIHWKGDHYEVSDKKQWQTITTQLNGDSNTLRNDSQVTTIQVNAKLTQFQNIQQSMQQAIQGVAGALNQMIQGAAR